MRRIGVLMSTRAGDPEGEARSAAFLHGLQELGWTIDRNVQIDIRWSAGNAGDIRKYAAELVALAPDVILASGGSVVGPLLQATRTVPVVFLRRRRSGRRRFCRQPGAAGRQRHRIYSNRIRHRRKMDGVAQGDCAEHDTSGGPSRPCNSSRNRPVRRDPIRGSIASGWR